jgi:hypothetical protein
MAKHHLAVAQLRWALSCQTGGILNTGNMGGEARLPGLIQTMPSDESDDKASAGRGSGLVRTNQ